MRIAPGATIFSLVTDGPRSLAAQTAILLESLRLPIRSMHGFGGHIQHLWMNGHSADYIVWYISSRMVLHINVGLTTTMIHRHVQSEILPLTMTGFIPSGTTSNEVAANSWC